MTQRLHLPNVTLFVTAGPDLELTLESFERCLKTVDFGGKIFFSEGPKEKIPYYLDYVVPIQPTGSAQNSGIHYFRTLPEMLKTSHILTVDWDAGIVDPDCWTDEFLEYDYIGARWPWLPTGKNIGNSGFCLMSKKLMETVARFDLKSDGIMDADIGQKWRPNLEMAGFKFPSEALADRFAYERAVPNAPTFGYHGFFNMHRHMSDANMMLLVTKLSDSSVKGVHYLELMLTYVALRKFPVFFAMYKRMMMVDTADDFRKRFTSMGGIDTGVTMFLSEMCDLAEKQK
jgi:hypothetical protein